MTVIPRGFSQKNVGHGNKIEITIYCRNPLKRFAPTNAEEARMRMKKKDGMPIMPPLRFKDGQQD